MIGTHLNRGGRRRKLLQILEERVVDVKINAPTDANVATELPQHIRHGVVGQLDPMVPLRERFHERHCQGRGDSGKHPRHIPKGRRWKRSEQCSEGEVGPQQGARRHLAQQSQGARASGDDRDDEDEDDDCRPSHAGSEYSIVGHGDA